MLAEYPLTTRGSVSRRLGSWLARGLPPSAALALCLWIESPRFALKTPSLVDDWFGITYSGRALHALLHAHYSSAAVDFAGRYRPGYTAIWNYAQWHLLGPPSMAVAGFWATGRIVAFFASVSLITAFVVGGRAPFTRPLIWLAPLAVAMTPGIAVDLARYGPTEPLMLAGIIIGLALIAVGLRVLLSRDGSRLPRPLAWGAIGVGYFTYLVGIYSKETSVCLVVFLPFFLKWLAVRLPRETARSLWRARSLRIVALFLIAPLIHIGVEFGLSVSAGHTPYPTAGVSGGHVGNTLIVAAIAPLVGAPATLGTYLWLLAVPIAIGIAAAMCRRRDPDALLVVGILVTGWIMTVIALGTGETPSRYFIPWIVAVAAVLIRGLSRAGRRLQATVAVLLIAAAPVGARHAIDHWVQEERIGSAAVDMAATKANCRLYLANFDVERRVAIPRLLPFAHENSGPSCNDDSQTAYVLNWAELPLPPGFAARCSSSWLAIAARRGVRMYRCRSFRANDLADQDAASGDSRIRVVRLRVPTSLPQPNSLFQPS